MKKDGTSKRSVYLLLVGILICVILLITGHMDLDWKLVSYYFDSVQNTWDYWKYCPFIRTGWWTAYFIDLVRMVVGWFGLGWLLNEVKHCLALA